MARTISILAPSGRTLTLRLVTAGDVIAETIALAERANALGVYVGTLTAAAGTYRAVLLDDAEVLGAWEAVEITGETDEDAWVREKTTGQVTAEVDAEELAVVLAPLVWSNSERTLTTPAQIPDDETSVASISRRRGDSWSVSLTGLGSIAHREATWWTIKRSQDDSDAIAILQATEGLGITVDDESAGNITLDVLPAVTALITPRSYYYDVQVLLSDGTVQTLAEGRFEVLADVTRATALPEEEEP
jgi:hypothetical protein